MVDPEVYKLSIYVTPKQWERISAWSAALGGDHAPWLHMEHESGKYFELIELQNTIKAILEPYNISVNIVPPQVTL
jgi:hypothetical protein